MRSGSPQTGLPIGLPRHDAARDRHVRAPLFVLGTLNARMGAMNVTRTGALGRAGCGCDISKRCRLDIARWTRPTTSGFMSKVSNGSGERSSSCGFGPAVAPERSAERFWSLKISVQSWGRHPAVILVQYHDLLRHSMHCSKHTFPTEFGSSAASLLGRAALNSRSGVCGPSRCQASTVSNTESGMSKFE
jgi:hypothetical protein